MDKKKDNCLICDSKEATKKNSHIIPSFLASMVSSYDHSYKRDKDLLFKIEPYKENIYIGGLPDTKLESVFDYSNLTEDRIKNELSTNPVALDFVFCPECESNLSTYLETPYAENLFKNKKKNPIEQLIFWISVIWRMSVTNNSGFRLPKDTENELRLRINEFFELSKSKSDSKSITKTLNLNYRVVYCPNYCKSNGGYIYADYNQEKNILSFMIGDISLCVTFDKSDIPDDYSFFGLENHFRSATNNNGNAEEDRKIISVEDYKKSIDKYVKFHARIKYNEYVDIIDKMWTLSGRPNYMPIKMKLKFMEMLLDENVKIGERKTNNRFVDILNVLTENIMTWY
jgi:hypothetical protein